MLLCMFYVWEQDYSGTTHLLSATTSHCRYRKARYRALTEQETIPIDLESIVSQRSRLIAKLVEQMLSAQQASSSRLLHRYVKRNWKYLNTVQRTRWFISGMSIWKMFHVIYGKLTLYGHFVRSTCSMRCTTWHTYQRYISIYGKWWLQLSIKGSYGEIQIFLHLYFSYSIIFLTANRTEI